MKKFAMEQLKKAIQFFTRRRKMNNRGAFLTVLVLYALFGAYSLTILIKQNGNEALKFLFVSTSTIEITQAKEEKKEEKEVKKEIEIVDCYTALEYWGEKYNIDEDLAKRIIKAESDNNPKAKNGKSTARGCGQFIIGTWESYGKKLWGDEFYNKNVYNPKDNVELMVWAISNFGTGDWSASKNVWQ